MSADIIILFPADKGWAERPLVDPFCRFSRPASLVVACERGGDEGGHPVYQVAQGDQGDGCGRVIDGQAANVAGFVKKFCRKLVGIVDVVGHGPGLLEIEDAARMGGNDAPVAGNSKGFLP